MRIEGRRTFTAGPETLWSLLHDPDTLKRILPDCDALEATAPDEYRLTIDTRIGRDIEHLGGVLRFDRVTPYQGFDFEAESENRPGYLYTRGRVTLEPEAAGLTTLVYEADIEASGRFARISPRLLQTIMNAIARRSLDALEQQVALRAGVFPTTATPATDGVAARLAVDLPAFLRRSLIIGLTLVGILFIIRGLGRRSPPAVVRQTVEMPERSPDELQTPSSGARVRSRV